MHEHKHRRRATTSMHHDDPCGSKDDQLRSPGQVEQQSTANELSTTCRRHSQFTATAHASHTRALVPEARIWLISTTLDQMLPEKKVIEQNKNKNKNKSPRKYTQKALLKPDYLTARTPLLIVPESRPLFSVATTPVPQIQPRSSKLTRLWTPDPGSNFAEF